MITRDRLQAAIEASQYFPGQNYTGVIGARLDNFTTNPDAPGYKLLHGIKMPFDNAVGCVPSFPYY